MKNYCETPRMKKLMFVLLAGGGLTIAQVHAAGVGASVGTNAQVGVGGGAGAVGAGIGVDANAQAGSAGTTSPDPAARIESAAETELKADGSMKQPMPMMQDSTRGLEHAKEQMSPKGLESEQATEATGKIETKKTAKTKRDKKPSRNAE